LLLDLNGFHKLDLTDFFEICQSPLGKFRKARVLPICAIAESPVFILYQEQRFPEFPFYFKTQNSEQDMKMSNVILSIFLFDFSTYNIRKLTKE
jgi:hypothetical protein